MCWLGNGREVGARVAGSGACLVGGRACGGADVGGWLNTGDASITQDAPSPSALL